MDCVCICVRRWEVNMYLSVCMCVLPHVSFNRFLVKNSYQDFGLFQSVGCGAFSDETSFSSQITTVFSKLGNSCRSEGEKNIQKMLIKIFRSR